MSDKLQRYTITMKTLKLSFLTILLACATLFANAQGAAPANNVIDKIATAYLAVKNALVAGDGNLTQAKAQNLLTLLSANPEQGLKPEQQKFWATYIDKLEFDSRHMSETTGIAHQREHFANLSKNMYAVLKKLKLTSFPLYEQYCPMKKAYWISETSTIKNPYYGKEMLDCGTTKETL